MSTLVAVYGSLLSGLHNHPHLGDSSLVGKTKVPLGPMVSCGSYPAIIGTGVNMTPVEIYRVNDSIMRNLDMLEGHPHFYFRTPIQTEFGRAWVYIWPEDRRGQPGWGADDLPQVENNDWRAYVEAQRSAA